MTIQQLAQITAVDEIPADSYNTAEAYAQQLKEVQELLAGQGYGMSLEKVWEERRVYNIKKNHKRWGYVQLSKGEWTFEKLNAPQ